MSFSFFIDHHNTSNFQTGEVQKLFAVESFGGVIQDNSSVQTFSGLGRWLSW